MARVRINQAKKIAHAHKVTRPYIARTSELILQAARQMAPRGSHLSGSGQRRPGSQLSRSLKRTVATTTTSIVHSVGSTKDYAATVHQSSQPHIINAKGKHLRFRWDRGDQLVIARRRGRIGSRRPRPGKDGFFYFVRVRHPGNKRPVRYLTTPMFLFGRARGFRVDAWPAGRSRLP
jgi:hypothetical protein